MTDLNPYAPPPAADAHTGSAATADGDFSISEVLTEAWSLAQGHKVPFLAVYAVVFLAVMLLSVLLGMLFGTGPHLLSMFIQQVVIAAVIYPCVAGVVTLGLRRAAGLPVAIADATPDTALLVPVVTLGVLVSLATTIGFMFLVIPGVYLSVALMFALPLLLDRKLGAVAAMETSIRMVNRRWFKYFGFCVVIGLLIALSAVTVIGLIWTLPFSVIAVSIVYRHAFGITLETASATA